MPAGLLSGPGALLRLLDIASGYAFVGALDELLSNLVYATF